MSRASQSKTPLVRGEGREYLLRLILLMGVFALAGGAYWLHFERRFAAIQARHALRDDAGALGAADRSAIAARSALLRERWGLSLLIHVRPDEVPVPDLDAATVFVGVVPGGQQGVVVLPPLAGRAVTSLARRNLELDLDACTKNAPPGPCLVEALDRLCALLSADP